ncbi:MAG TPA: carboxynorspermidine decarboxylase [Phycisphaerales bacterium]|nr:carboxynorspermidine decarboxylase [Phycisphaerales bacterium]HCD34437.1 carboxynorspermidine decarboxylase [Phycisphaerales bacterium]|tara:strand:- start:42018 stop:43169 length:1152 start_codon:yes stop_codon:yes gene_type:complete
MPTVNEIDFARFPSPCFVCDLGLLRKNLGILKHVQDESGAKVLLALKGFAMWSTFSIVKCYLSGVCASSPDEARLGDEHFSKEMHSFAPAYKPEQLDDYIKYSDHMSFNSFSQWQRHKDTIFASEKKVSCGIRINPEHSEVETAIYDPCAPGSRLGVRLEDFRGQDLTGIEGLHCHTLCEKNVDSLQRTWKVVEEKFGQYLPQMKWLNLGGGHHITRDDYGVDELIDLVKTIKAKYDIEVYLEPGEAVALNTGILIAEVQDIVHNAMDIAILDTSASAHMPDVLEMPYRPMIIGSGLPGEKPHTYKLGGMTCLAGDVIGEYSFDQPLQVGQRLAFTDMIHYSMVKTTTFNGVHLPSIATYEPASDTVEIIREFTYEDYRDRLS